MSQFAQDQIGAAIGTRQFLSRARAVSIIKTDRHFGVVQDEIDFLGGQKIVERQHDAASPYDAEISRDVVRAIMAEKTHPVARLHAALDKLQREHRGQTVHFFVGEFFTVELDEGGAG